MTVLSPQFVQVLLTEKATLLAKISAINTLLETDVEVDVFNERLTGRYLADFLIQEINREVSVKEIVAMVKKDYP